jgi:hypothetical protein
VLVVVPAAAAAPVAGASRVYSPNGDNDVEEADSPLLRSQLLLIILPTLIGEVSFMLFLILKQLEEVG